MVDLNTGQSSRVDLGDYLGDAAATVGSKALLAGGHHADYSFFESGRTSVDIYDAANNVWSKATLSAPRLAMATATVGSKVIFAGGVDSISAGGIGPPGDAGDIYEDAPRPWSTPQQSAARS